MVTAGKYRGLSVLILTAGLICFWFCRCGRTESDAGRIRRSLEEICAIANTAAGKGNISGNAELLKLRNYFASACRISAPGYAPAAPLTPQDIVNEAMRGKVYVKALKSRISRPEIYFREDGQASAEFSLYAEGQTRYGYLFSSETDAVCELEKQNGRWVIRAVTVRPVLEK